MIKFSFTNKTIKFSGKTLYRIKAEISFGKIQEGDLGGFIEKENNLIQEGDAWVYRDAKVSGSAEVSGKAKVSNFKLINITGLKWNITISDYHIQIGSELHKIKEWEKFSDKKIAQIADEVLSWWKIYEDIILTIASRKLRRLDFVND